MGAWNAPATRKNLPHGLCVSLVGEVVTKPAALNTAPTEWPKIGCKVAVRHNEDQVTVVNVVTVGPAGDRLLATQVGAQVMVNGHLRMTTGQLEAFALEIRPGSVNTQPNFLKMLGLDGLEGDD